MKIHELLKMESDLMLRKPVTHKIKDVEISISTLTVGQVAEINPYLSKIAFDDLVDIQNMIETFEYAKLPAIVEKYLDPIQNIIRIITGSDHKDIATFEDYFILLALILSRIGNQSFQKSIILIGEMSLTRRPELIAAQKFLTSLN